MSKLNTIQEKTNKVAAEITAEQLKKDAHEAGFDDFDDYELWLALDALRKATLKRRSMRPGIRQDAFDRPTIGSLVGPLVIDASRI